MAAFALAEAIAVHDGDQIIQLVNARERRRFPDRAFCGFTVTEHHVGVVIQFVESASQRDTEEVPLASRQTAEQLPVAANGTTNRSE